jgi:hypothetical protein
MSGFFEKQLFLVLLDILRSDFDFNTIIKELFDFKGDSPVYSPPGSFDSPVYSAPRSLDSPVYSSPRSHCSGLWKA